MKRSPNRVNTQILSVYQENGLNPETAMNDDERIMTDERPKLWFKNVMHSSLMHTYIYMYLNICIRL